MKIFQTIQYFRSCSKNAQPDREAKALSRPDSSSFIHQLDPPPKPLSRERQTPTTQATLSLSREREREREISLARERERGERQRIKQQTRGALF